MKQTQPLILDFCGQARSQQAKKKLTALIVIILIIYDLVVCFAQSALGTGKLVVAKIFNNKKKPKTRIVLPGEISILLRRVFLLSPPNSRHACTYCSVRNVIPVSHHHQCQPPQHMARAKLDTK